MNFWKNPEYAPLKTLLAFVLALGIGWGVYNIAGDTGSLTGNILKGTKDKTEAGLSFDVAFDGKSCTITYCVTNGKEMSSADESNLCPPVCDNAVTMSSDSELCPPMCDVTYTETGACFVMTGTTKNIEGEDACQVDEKLSDELEKIITNKESVQPAQSSSSR